jgi:hypothetical protein
MPKPKKRTPPHRIDREAIRIAFMGMPLTFTWSLLARSISVSVSQTHLRALLLDEWVWIARTSDTQPTSIIRKGKHVGGRPQTVYRKTEAGKAADTAMLGSGSL